MWFLFSVLAAMAGTLILTYAALGDIRRTRGYQPRGPAIPRDGAAPNPPNCGSAGKNFSNELRIELLQAHLEHAARMTRRRW